MAAPDALDELILTLTNDNWQKVAMLVAKVKVEFEKRALDINHDKIAGRLESLVEQGLLEAKGRLSDWRNSEVRRTSFPV